VKPRMSQRILDQAFQPGLVENASGYSLAIIGRVESRADDTLAAVNLFTTGICLLPPENYHIEITLNRSGWSNGYVLASSPLIIDHDNCNEELVIPLIKQEDVPDMDLPLQCLHVRVVKTTSMYCLTENTGTASSSQSQTAPSSYSIPQSSTRASSSSGYGGFY